MINIFHNENLIAKFYKDSRKHILEYNSFDLNDSISISLPNTQKFYIYEQDFIPYFETFLPEGYLFEILKNYLIKEFGYIDDYLLFGFLSKNIEGRIRYSENTKNESTDLELNRILEEDTEDTFNYLLKLFFDKNALSGVQPKTMAILKDKENLKFKKYIVKTWGNEFPNLAENEYFCLKAFEFANIPTVKYFLSKNKRFLIIERFDNENTGFEEIISIMDKNTRKKYSGSYEQVAKAIYKFVSEPREMKIFFKMIVMNYLLRNGDAHLKNFGLIYNDDFSNISLAPAYDIVNTVAYIRQDKPALTLIGRKIWHGKKELVSFGIRHCYLKDKEADFLYEECIEALKKIIKVLEEYLAENQDFEAGKKMLEIWKISLEENHK